MDANPIPILSEDMAPTMRRFLASSEVGFQTDPLTRRVNSLMRAALEAKDYDLAGVAWLVSSLRTRGGRHVLLLDAALRSKEVRHAVTALVLSEPPKPAGEGVADAG